MLAKKFSSTWIRAHISDLVGQANLEYAEWLENNPPADSPIGWLLNCVWWRALTRYESESRRPPTASLEAVVQVQDQSAPNPEGELLDHDRQERLREAISNLPEKEQKLLALVYFEDYSIREAGRMLGWGKSSADRHHTAAMEKMRSLVGERSLLSPAILGPVAWVVINDQARGALGQAWDAALAPLHKATAVGSDVVQSGAHRIGELGRRLWPFADAGNAAATGGGGRVLGYCGAAAGAAVCGLLSTGAIGPGLGGSVHGQAKVNRAHAVRSRAVSSPAVESQSFSTSKLDLPETEPKPKTTDQNETAPRQPETRKRRPPVATGKQSASEFGDNNFGSSSSPSSAAAAPESATPSEAPAESQSETAVPPPSSGGSASGSKSSSEFGL